MLPEARQSVASALRRRFPVAGVPIWAPLLALMALVPVLFVIRTTSPAGHGKPKLPASVLNSSRLLELAEFDAKAAGLRAEIWTLLEDKHLEIDGPTDFRRILGQARQLLLPWSVRRFQNTTPHPEEVLSELVRSIDRTRKYASCAVVGNSGILLDAEYGASIDSHETVIRVKNAPVGGGLLSRHVGAKTTISFISGHVLHVCYGRRRKQCFCHPYGHAVPLVLYVLHPFHFAAVAGCNSTGVGNIFVTDPVFDQLCLKIVKYYSLRRWFTGGGSRRFSDWSVAHKGERFYYSSGMQAVLMAVGVCERVSLYGFGKSAMSKHHYHTRQKAEVKVHDYEAEYEFYRDLMESPARIPFLSSAVGKFKFPPVAIHGWGPV